MDPDHRLHEPQSEYRDVVRDYYILVDDLIGRLVRAAGDDTDVLVVSDHGAKRMDGAVCVNEWLRQHGYLTLRDEISVPRQFEPGLVDWSRTAAWGEGGYYARIFLNVKGREPQGLVPVADYDAVRTRIANGLEALGDETGEPIGTRSMRPEELYPIRNGVPPDLLVYFGNLHWRSSALVGGPLHLRENDTGPDDANHAHEGLYIAAGPRIRRGVKAEQRIEDVAPTILHLLEQSIPVSMQGHIFLACEAGSA
jgi:predicted AlkP superfamily phosphohydrolase/phosphomutase